MLKSHHPATVIRWACTAVLTLCALGPIASTVQANTLVRFSTTSGNFTVELFDETMPVTVANFLAYVRAERYANSFIHRSTTYDPASIQIVQGGGFGLSGSSIVAIATDAPIILEQGSPLNLRGTIAMARTSAPDSATSQWFFNVTDNPALDANYAVFGRVIDPQGLQVLDAIASAPVYDVSPQLGPVFSELPLTAPSLQVSSLVVVTRVDEISAHIISAAHTLGGFRLEWTTVPGALPVTVERQASLGTGDWIPISSNNTTGTFTDSSAPPDRAFYRVKVH